MISQNSFWENILDYLDEDELIKIQDFISSSGLSSHMMNTSIK